MCSSMTSEVIFNLCLFNVIINKIGSEMYVLERQKLKYQSPGITEFLVRYRRTYFLKVILI